MGQPFQNEVNGRTIQTLLDQMEATTANCNAAQQSVDAVGSSLQWRGEAAVQYRNALAGWNNGMRKVQNGLKLLNQAMADHLRVSANTEDMQVEDATWYRGS